MATQRKPLIGPQAMTAIRELIEASQPAEQERKLVVQVVPEEQASCLPGLLDRTANLIGSAIGGLPDLEKDGGGGVGPEWEVPFSTAGSAIGRLPDLSEDGGGGAGPEWGPFSAAGSAIGRLPDLSEDGGGGVGPERKIPFSAADSTGKCFRGVGSE